MSTADIFNKHLLEDKPITLELNSKYDLDLLLGCLRVYKSRYEKQMKALEIPELDLIQGRVITHEIVSESPNNLIVKIFLAEKKEKTNGISFKILSD